jgi:hypothetical protein
MVNYSNGKIYKIEPTVEHDAGDIYIGSTTKKYLSQRMDSHRSTYKYWKKHGKYPLTSSYLLFDKYGVDNCKIVLLELVNAESRDELCSRESYYVQTMVCKNKHIPNKFRKLGAKEYYRQHYKENRDKLLECITCDVCHCSTSKLNIKKHERTKLHMNNLNKYDYFWEDGTKCSVEDYVKYLK